MCQIKQNNNNKYKSKNKKNKTNKICIAKNEGRQ